MDLNAALTTKVAAMTEDERLARGSEHVHLTDEQYKKLTGIH